MIGLDHSTYLQVLGEWVGHIRLGHSIHQNTDRGTCGLIPGVFGTLAGELTMVTELAMVDLQTQLTLRS